MKMEVFRSGVWKGIAFPPERVKRIVQQYNRTYPEIEAPAVIGHPDELDPSTEAYGWVKKLEFSDRVDPKTGKTFTSLYAHFDQFVPEFAQAIKAGRWKQRSIKLRGDQLTHVGFLGGMLPAVKGLDPIPADAFSDDDSDDSETLTQEFAELTSNRATDMTKEEHEKALEEALSPLKKQIETLKGKLTAREEAEKEAKEKAEKFAEDQKAKEKTEEVKALEAKLAAAEDKVLEAEFSEYLGSDKMRQKITPAIKGRVVATMKRLAKDDSEMEFSEGDEKVKSKAVDAFKGLLESLPDQVEFSEIATPGKAREEKAATTGADKYQKEGSLIAQALNPPVVNGKG